MTSVNFPDPDDDSPAAVVGAGSIGVSWAVVLAGAGRRVNLFDRDGDRLAHAVGEVAVTVASMVRAGLLTEDPADVVERVSACPDLPAAVAGAAFVQESIVEDLSAKQELFATLDALAAPGVVLASSSSTIAASLFAADLPGRDRCLVVHPGNPPYFLRVAEIVPAPFTSPVTVQRARDFVASLRMSPVVLGHEVEGFVFNRLQGALLREAYCLVRDGVIAPTELDTLVREGLAQRWALLGPFATSELNTRGGLRHHAELHGKVYARLGRERAQDDPWTPENVEHVAAEIEAALPHSSWEANVRERDELMIQVAALHRDLVNPLAPAPEAQEAPVAASVP